MQSPHDAMEPVIEYVMGAIAAAQYEPATFERAIRDLVIGELMAVLCYYAEGDGGPLCSDAQLAMAEGCPRCQRLAEWKAIRDG